MKKMLAALLSSMIVLLFSNVHALFRERIERTKLEAKAPLKVAPQLSVIEKKSQLISQLNQEKKKLAILQNKLKSVSVRRKPSITAKIKETEQKIETLKKKIGTIR